MSDLNVEQQLAGISKRLEVANRLWAILSAAVVILFGAGVFFANTVSDYNSLKREVGSTAQAQLAIVTRVDELGDNTEAAVKSISAINASLDALKSSFPVPYEIGEPITVSSTGTLSKSITARYCALSYIVNNNHSESACECGVTRSGDTWTLTVKNAVPSLTCTCEASCMK